MKVAAIVPSAGKGKRLKSNVEKPYLQLGNKPILAHTLLRLSSNKHINEIVLAVTNKSIDFAREKIINRYGIKKIYVVIGGKERRDSVYNALKRVSMDIDYILIHDGVRPFITDNLIEYLLKAASKFGASVACVPVKPTLKIVDKQGFIKDTPLRRYYWEAQTPQVFKRDLIEKAYENAIKKDIKASDDSMLVELMGAKPKIVMGSYSNIKITTEEDLELAKILLKTVTRNT